MIYLINYADSAYKNAQNNSTKYAYRYGKVDVVTEYGPSDIDKEFYDNNIDILSVKRGAGLWLWKPYIVLKKMKEIKEGDYLVYLDSGALLLRNIQELISKMKSDFYVSRLPLYDNNYTSDNVLKYFNDSGESQQILATFFIMKKSDKTIGFLEEWLNLCCNIDLLQGDNKGDNFIAHREDQSLFSMLIKKKRIESHTDPSQFGFFPSKYIVQNENHKYFLEKYNENSKIVIFCHRQRKVTFSLRVKAFLYKHMPKCILLKEIKVNNK